MDGLKTGSIYLKEYQEEIEMSRKLFALLTFAVMALLMFGSGCGPKPEPVVEEPVVEEPVEPAEEPVTEPVVEPEPEPVRLTESQFKVAYFDFDKYNLRPDTRAALEFNARLLKDHPNVSVLLEGHCDERGTIEYNLTLGENRARTAKEYLVSLGVPENRMDIVSYGKERPMALGHNEESWQQNRRVQFTITGQ